MGEKALLYDDEVRSAQTKKKTNGEKLSTALHRRGIVTSHLIRNVFATLEVAGRNSHSRRRDTRRYARLRNETGGKQIAWGVVATGGTMHECTTGSGKTGNMHVDTLIFYHTAIL